VDREQLLAEFKRIGCLPRATRDSYSSLLIRCGCGRHALAAAACGEKPGETAKLFGAALSWYRASNLKEPLRFVVGKDKGGHWEKAIFAIRTVAATQPNIEILADFRPTHAPKNLNLFEQSWLDAMLDEGRRILPVPADRIAAHPGLGNFRWYRSVTGDEWSGRIDGLQVCAMSKGGQRLTFSVGHQGKGEDSPARLAFKKLFRDNKDLGRLDSDEHLVMTPVDEPRAIAILQRLAKSDIAANGSAEHRFEAKVLDGRVTLKTNEGRELRPLRTGPPFQFPTRWWPNGRARYVDVFAHDEDVPWVIELKVEVGQGQYYRDGLVQVALYREFVRRSEGLDPWFKKMKLTRDLCKAALVIPPLRGPDRENLLADHQSVARDLGVEVLVSREAV
jgi:hypothetical protein